MAHEMKKQFNSMLNLKDDQSDDNRESHLKELNTNQWFTNNFDEWNRQCPSGRKPSNFFKKTHLYPNIDGDFMEMQNRSEKKDSSNLIFDERDEYDQETENFFGKKPDGLFNDEFDQRPDRFFSKISLDDENNSNLLEISERFSDNFKDDLDAADSSNSLYNSAEGERGDTENAVEDGNKARAGAAWVDFVNV